MVGRTFIHGSRTDDWLPTTVSYYRSSSRASICSRFRRGSHLLSNPILDSCRSPYAPLSIPLGSPPTVSSSAPAVRPPRAARQCCGPSIRSGDRYHAVEGRPPRERSSRRWLARRRLAGRHPTASTTAAIRFDAARRGRRWRCSPRDTAEQRCDRSARDRTATRRVPSIVVVTDRERCTVRRPLRRRGS